jgi:hypothetical protein
VIQSSSSQWSTIRIIKAVRGPETDPNMFRNFVNYKGIISNYRGEMYYSINSAGITG